MAKLDRDGVKIHYEIHGPPRGPALLLSHGYSSTSRMWDGQVAALKDRYRVIVWDMRGHGESDYPADQSLYSEALTVGDMLALLDLDGAQKAIVAGLSLGGYMSLAFHASHPDRVRALMLFDTGPGFKKDEARAKWNETAHKRAAAFDTNGLAALNTSDEVKIVRHRDASGLARAARGMLAQQNDRVIQSLDTIAVPTLVLVGANDTNFLAATNYMAAKIKGSTKVVIPDAGHAANLHQPALFNQAVEAFLAKLPANTSC
ncbi:Pimeloyl-ACP methyl ester carboxylesterase [Enhydrobacter aerosaccus]|uniref:Pimeloyl-ACP methyl ester carboxylesterase n=1 Tax=Enhydrobacter aerosaccus TaxID=225324 RepID=A0A1T4R828_9HYPH|nr:alpha/beta fold hydrolase [Enhydrobacter aerosaccus]SKA11771.1 Pimeloyl-ACP methyl ester carboxylesterase [Enhydrobacter aerosaccus]